MTLSEQIEEILPETISALSRLQPEELEDLELRLKLLVESCGPGSILATRGLQSKLDSLQACLSSTEANIRVVQSIRDQGARA
jgi:hypothetical protein